MDVDSEDEELANLHVYFPTVESNFTCEGDLSGDIFTSFNGIVNKFFKEGGLFIVSTDVRGEEEESNLDTLSQSMRNCQLRHVVSLFA